MKTLRQATLLSTLILPAILLATSMPPARAICIPFPCEDCWIASQGQFNLVVMDRNEGLITLIPNIRFTGNAADFALVVPTPTIPELSQAPSEVWDELTLLTQSVGGRRPDDFDFGCDDSIEFVNEAPGSPRDDGVTIHGEVTIGQFMATILSSDDPNALVDWLADNGFAIEPEDAARFTSYVERDWFFTAMKPDTTLPGNRMPPDGWDADVDPVAFTYAAEMLELPLPVLTINSASRLPLSFYVIDDHRMAFPLFDTIYANRVNASELATIARRHPALATLLSPGRFLTRLDRTVITSPEPTASIFLERAPTDEEFRRTGSSGFFPVPLFIVGAFMIMTRRRVQRAAPAD